MNIKTLIKKLNNLGINDISEDTLQDWASKGLIPHSKPVESSRSPGRPTEYPEHTVEEAAAVWYIKKMLGKRNILWEVIKLARSWAKDYHTALMTDLDECEKRFSRWDRGLMIPPYSEEILSLSEEEQRRLVREDGTMWRAYIHSHELDPLIILWICAVEKVRHKCKIDTPVRVSFDWEATEQGLQFRGTHMERAEKDTIRCPL